MFARHLVFALLILRFVTQIAAAEDATQSLLIEPVSLEKLLDDKPKHLVVLDTRGQDEFVSGHIPNAILVDVDAFKSQALARGGLTDKNAWGKLVGGLGIAPQSRVIVYGGPDKGLASAARVWWTLKYVGVEKVQLLNGGWPVWKNEKRPVESGRRIGVVAEFVPRFQTSRLVMIDDLKKWVAEGKVAVVDARSTEEFEGRDDLARRKGHIPGAKHLEWKDLLADDGRFKSREELRAIFAGLGLKSGDHVATHCQTGGRSSVNTLALELAGFENVRNYYCGWQEWSADEKAPVARPAE